MSAHAADDVLGGREPAPAESRAASLFGVDGARIRWEHGLVLFAALFLESIAKFGIARWIHGGGRRSWTDTAWILLERLGTEAALALLILLAYRFIRRPSVAIPVVALGYALVHMAFMAGTGLQAPQGARPAFSEILLQAGSTGFIYAALMLAVLEIALRRLRNLPVVFFAASIGAAVGAVAWSALFIYPMFFGASLSLSSLLSGLPMALAGGVIFALVWWGGLAIAAATPFFRPPAEVYLSRSFYAGAIYALLGVPMFTLILVVLLTVTRNWRADGITATLLIITWLVMVAGAVVVLRFVYRMWDGLRADGPRTSPGKAVALLFIPVFNLYWMFQVFGGFATDFNRAAAARNVAVRLPRALFAAYPIAAMLAAFPIWGMLSTPVALGILLAIVAKASDALNALDVSRATAAEGAAPAGSPISR